MHGTPSIFHSVLEAIKFDPEALEVEMLRTSVLWRAMEEQRTMIRNSRSKIMEETVRLRNFPVRGAEESIIVDERGRVPLVGPGVTTTMHVHILQLHIGNEAAETARCAPVDTPITLVLSQRDKVEVTPEEPGAGTRRTSFLQVFKE